MDDSRLSWSVRLLTLVLIPFLSVNGGWEVALVIILAGVPHGAADHLLFVARYPRHRRPGSLRFALFYLVACGLYGLLWSVLPTLSFGIFLLVSLYHFGQTGGGSRIVRLAWGLFGLGFPVLYHFAAARPIIAEMTGSSLFIPLGVSRGLAFGLLAAAVALAVLRSDYRRLLDLAILTALFIFTGLLTGFAVYFLLWHSLPAARDQFRYLRHYRLSGRVTGYLKQLIPLSVLALLAMVLAGVYMDWQGKPDVMFARLFIFVSIITLPHALLVDTIYTENFRRRYP
jgi:Brp/Blh family beta-carotene 15,15'-monooxygenase